MSARRQRTGKSTRLGEAARGLLRKLDKADHMEKAHAVGAWREIAGEEVSRHAMGFAMRRDELIVFTDSTVWATELSALSERYRTDINRRVGRELVGSIRFTVSKHAGRGAAGPREAGQVARAGGADRVPTVQCTDAERAQIEGMASAIHDGALRDAAIRAALRGLEWQKGREKGPSEGPAEGHTEDPEIAAEH